MMTTKRPNRLKDVIHPILILPKPNIEATMKPAIHTNKFHLSTCRTVLKNFELMFSLITDQFHLLNKRSASVALHKY